MNRISVVLLLVLFCGCSSKDKKMNVEIERIPINVYNISQDASSFIDKIELVPLETNDSSLLHSRSSHLYIFGQWRFYK